MLIHITIAAEFLPTTSVHGFSAASAGVIATLVTHPFDVVKVNTHLRFFIVKLTRVFSDQSASSFGRKIHGNDAHYEYNMAGRTRIRYDNRQ